MVQSLTARVGISIFILAFASLAQAESTPRFDGRSFGIDIQGEYFMTDENLDGVDGSRDSLPGGNSFETFTTRAMIDTLLTRNWQVGVGGEIVYASSVGEFEDKSATELNNAFIQTQYQFATGTFRLIPQLMATFTVEEVNRNTNDVLTGEGTNMLEAGSWFMIDMKYMEGYAYGGYRQQDDGRAHLMPWRVGGQAYVFKKIYARGEVGGHFSVKDDKYKNRRIERTNLTNRVDGGSYRYYSVNPNLIELRAETGLEFSPETEFFAGITHTVAGEAVAYGLSVYGGIRYSANPKPTSAGYDADEVQPPAPAPEPEPAVEAPPVPRKRGGQRRVAPEFTPQLEDYDPAMFEKEVNKGKRK